MNRKTETTKHVVTEEEETESGASSEEEEEEEGTESTGSTGTGGESTGTTHSSEEEEEEEETGSKSKEEEEKALSLSVGKAMKSSAVHSAFLAALPEKYRAEGELFAPRRLASATRAATGAKSTFAAMHSLSDLKANARKGDEGLLRKQAKLETRVAKVEGDRRKDRVSAIVEVAKENGVAGATTKDGRQALRDYGMKHGTKALSDFIGNMPRIGRKDARQAGADSAGNPRGAPTAIEQQRDIEKALLAGITDPKEKEALLAEFNEKMKAMNGAATEEV
jgi:hypothetical protein